MSAPDRLTSLTDTESLQKLAFLAAMIAVEAPVKRADFSIRTPVRWQIIDMIRAELTGNGLDWKATRKRAQEIVTEKMTAEIKGIAADLIKRGAKP